MRRSILESTGPETPHPRTPHPEVILMTTYSHISALLLTRTHRILVKSSVLCREESVNWNAINANIFSPGEALIN